MIGYLYGNSTDTGTGVATILVNGVGYEVNTSVAIRNDPCLGLWVHEHAPQDAPHELYGFRERADRDLFRRLLNVQGVGPRVAMRIVTNAGVTREGIVVPATLRAIRGVGPKIIQNICEAFS